MPVVKSRKTRWRTIKSSEGHGSSELSPLFMFPEFHECVGGITLRVTLPYGNLGIKGGEATRGQLVTQRVHLVIPGILH